MSFSDLASDTWDDIKKGVEAFRDFTKEKWQETEKAITNFINDLTQFLKDLSSVMHEVAAWSVEELRRLTIELLQANIVVMDILTAAINESEELLQKMVQAICVLENGLVSIADWLAVSANIPYVGQVVSALLAASILPLEILKAGLITAELLLEVTKALVNAAETLTNYFQQIVDATAEMLLAAMKALFDLGYTLLDITGELAIAVMSHLARGQFLKALCDLGHAVLDILKAAATFGVTVLAIIFAGFVSLWDGRRLTLHELLEAMKVYGYWNKLLDVWIVIGTIPAEIVGYINNEVPFTTMATIVFPNRRSYSDQTMIHELMHVHQNVTGGAVYMVKSLEEQLREGRDHAYDYDLSSHQKLEEFDIEEQACIVEYYYVTRFIDKSAYDKYIPFVRDLLVPRPAFGSNDYRRWSQRIKTSVGMLPLPPVVTI